MIQREYTDKISPDLGKLLERVIGIASNRFKCHRVGQIVAFDKTNMTVTVRLLDKFMFRGNQEDFIQLSQVPLIVYAKTGSGLTLGNVVGSECLVHFNDTDIDNWFLTGEPYEPNSPRQHDLADGFAELRPMSTPNIPSTYNDQATVLYNGNVKVILADNGSATLTDGTSTLSMNGSGEIGLTNGNAIINVNGSDITITGNVTVNGTITSTGDMTANGISVTTHVHGGVSGGNSKTGTPE